MVEMKMGTPSTACGILILTLHIFQVTGCGEGYVQRSIEINGVVEYPCCKEISCEPEYEVKECRADGGIDSCEPCPNGFTMPQATSSYDPRPCYREDPSCGEEAEMRTTSDGPKCECKPGYCGKYPDCLKPPCPGQDTLAPSKVTTMVSATTRTTTTTTTATSTGVIVALTLPAEKPLSPELNPGTTPATMTVSTNQMTSSTDERNGNDWMVPVIVIVIAIIIVGVLFSIWCYRRHRGNTSQQYDSVSGDEERGVANGGQNGIARSPSREALNQRVANGGHNGIARSPSREALNQNGGHTVLNVNAVNVQFSLVGGQNVMNTHEANQQPCLNGSPVANHESSGGPTANGNNQHEVINMPEPDVSPAEPDVSPAAPQPVEEQRSAVQEVQGGDPSDYSSLLVS